jgi:RNA polymerase sigma factor (sigma-70 family)
MRKEDAKLMRRKLTDKQLVEKTLEGDINAFGILVNRYRGLVHGLTFHVVSNFQDAEDIAQEAFIKAYESLSTLKDKAKFGSWLRIITLNLCKMWLRRSPQELLLSSEFDPVKEDISPSDELQEIVFSALSALPSKNQVVIALFYLDDLSYKEIGDFLGLPISTIQSRLQRARQQLKEEVLKMAEDIFQNNKLGSKFTQKVLDEIIADGRERLYANKHDEAEALFKKALEIKPDSAEVHLYIGFVKEDQEIYNEAMDWYRKALELNPDYARAYYSLAIALGCIGKREEAITIYEKMVVVCNKLIELNPDDPELYVQLGEAYIGEGDMESSISALRHAIELKPDFAEAYATLANIYQYKTRDLEEAKKLLMKILEIGTDSGRVHGGFGANVIVMAYNNLGSIYDEEGDYDQAIFYLQKALEKTKDLGGTGENDQANLGVAYANKGSYLANKGEYAESIANYKETIKIYDSLTKLAGHRKPSDYIKWRLDNGKANDVIKAFESVIAQNPEDAEAYYCLACLYSVNRDANKVSKAISKAIELDPNYSEKAKTSSFFN